MTNVLIPLLCVCLLALPAPALVNAQPPDEDDTRFDAVAAWGHTARLYPGRGHDAEHQWYGAAVLIAPDVVLTAKHLLPHGEDRLPRPGTMTVRFRRHADGTLGSKDNGADSYHQVAVERFVLCPDSDLMLCILREPVEHIRPVELDLSDEASDEAGVVFAAWGSTSNWQGNGGPRHELRVGTNTARIGRGMVSLLAYETEARRKRNGDQGRYITDEHTVPNMFDSGGSIFREDDEGRVRLIGIIATYGGGTWLARYAEDERFPLVAATRGADALREALDPS
jgi:hypothetical protein